MHHVINMSLIYYVTSLFIEQFIIVQFLLVFGIVESVLHIFVSHKLFFSVLIASLPVYFMSVDIIQGWPRWPSMAIIMLTLNNALTMLKHRNVGLIANLTALRCNFKRINQF